MTSNKRKNVRIEQRPVIKFVKAEKLLKDLYGEACFSKKKSLQICKKEGRNCIQNKNWPSRLTIVSSLEIVDLVNTLVLSVVVTVENISKQLGISLGTTYQNAHDACDCSKVSIGWISTEQCKAPYCRRKLFVRLVGNSLPHPPSNLVPLISICLQRAFKNMSTWNNVLIDD